MPRGTLTIYDVPDAVRAKGAAESRKRILQMLMNPYLSQSQRDELQQQLQMVSRWENLDLEDVIKRQPQVEAPKGTDHSVEISESLSVEEG